MTLESRGSVTLSEIVKEIAERDAAHLDASILGYAAAQAHAISSRGEKPEDYIMYIEQRRNMNPTTMGYTLKTTLFMEKRHGA